MGKLKFWGKYQRNAGVILKGILDRGPAHFEINGFVDDYLPWNWNAGIRWL